MMAYTASLMIGTAGLPHVIIRFFTVPKVRDARSSAGWALLFIALLYTTAPAVAGMARLNLMHTLEPSPGQHLVIEERPEWFKKWEATGLLAYEDKNGDGKIQYSADKERNEMTKIDRDILVLANLEIAKLPFWVIALVAAGDSSSLQRSRPPRHRLCHLSRSTKADLHARDQRESLLNARELRWPGDPRCGLLG